MVLIGFDTSTAATAVCLERADGELFEIVPDVGAALARPRHAGELMPGIAAVMKRAGLGFGDLDALAVGCGPGGFTGLRIGIATARALGRALQLPVHPVSSLAALAFGIDAPLALPVMDAKRGEVFAALYRGAELELEPFAIRGEELAGKLAGKEGQPLAAGEGSLRFREALEAAGIAVVPGNSSLHVVRALYICRLAKAAPAVCPEAVLPIYLRSPDARPNL